VNFLKGSNLISREGKVRAASKDVIFAKARERWAIKLLEILEKEK